MSKKKPLIQYTTRDYDSIRNDLIEFAKRYYPNTFKDFNEASFGMMMLESVSYIGDILSFYLDYQANESFFGTAVEYGNVVKHARAKGYKLNPNQSSMGTVSFYVMVPANSVGIGPDITLIPTLRRGTTVSNGRGSLFTLVEDVDFSKTSNEIVVARTNEQTGVPTAYAIKASGRAISGDIRVKTFNIGQFERFKRVNLGDPRITEVISVFDDEGHEYFEVPHLSQDVMYLPVPNYNDDKELTPSILKPVPVPRRFTVEYERGQTFMQFGYGSDSELTDESLADPASIAFDVHGRDYVSDASFDPSNILDTDKFGIGPSNTTLTVEYRANTAQTVNAAVNTITEVVSPIWKFSNQNSLLSADISFVQQSLEVTNEEPFVGDVSLPTAEEIKVRAKNFFATQNRAVTAKDYESLAYSMPTFFGSLKRVKIVQDNNSFKRNLNMYVISEDSNGNLITANNTLKTNLKTWLARHKMINDSIDILDAKIVNFGVQFNIVAEPDWNRYDALQSAITTLREKFLIHYEIGEPISISKIYNTLNEADGVEDTVDVKVTRKVGSRYSSTRFDFDKYVTADGRLIRGFKNIIFEMKYPNSDIEGVVL